MPIKPAPYPKRKHSGPLKGLNLMFFLEISFKNIFSNIPLQSYKPFFFILFLISIPLLTIKRNEMFYCISEYVVAKRNRYIFKGHVY